MNPLSAIYGQFVSARNRLYDGGVFKAHKLSAPVISVGNLSVGGSGKTPFVILLGELLKQRRIDFDVLSRGYGRKTSGILEVDPNGKAVIKLGYSRRGIMARACIFLTTDSSIAIWYVISI